MTPLGRIGGRRCAARRDGRWARAMVLAALALPAVGTAGGAAEWSGRPTTSQPVVVSSIGVVDGDTIRIDRTRIRLLDIDTPEITRPRCPEELARGQAARKRLEALIERAGRAELVGNGTRDPNGRPLARLILDGRDVGEVLVADGLAVPWRPGREAWVRRGQHWCPGWVPPATDE